MLEIIIAVFSISTPVIMAVWIRTLNKREKAAEEWRRQLIEGRSLDKGFVDKTGELAHKIAICAREKHLFNGDLDTTIQEYEYIEGKRNNFYNEIIGGKVLKGGCLCRKSINLGRCG